MQIQGFQSPPSHHLCRLTFLPGSMQSQLQGQMAQKSPVKYIKLTWAQEKDEVQLTLLNDRDDVVARVLLYLYTNDYNDEEVPSFGIEKSQGAMTTQHSVVPGNDLFCGNSNQDPENPSSEARTINSTMREAAMYVEEIDVTPEPVRQLVSAMEVNAQVYICADKFGLDRLKDYATEKFMYRLAILEEESDVSAAWPVIQKVYENTSSGDKGIRRSMTRYCIEHYRLIRCVKEIVEAVEKHEPTAWSLALELQEQRAKEQARAEEDLFQAREEVGTVISLVNERTLFVPSRCRQENMLIECLENQKSKTKQYQSMCKCCDRRDLSKEFPLRQ